jgi:glycosyltransferase involved in cell wall biosynthesis
MNPKRGRPLRIAIVGSAGVPASYGGFETLAENLAIYNNGRERPHHLAVFCSKQSRRPGPKTFRGANLHYIPLNANGPWSPLYDVLSMLGAIVRGVDVIVLLGVSGALALPILRLITTAKIITNIDGVEWQRQKWGWVAKRFLQASERAAVRYSHQVISDNIEIARHVRQRYRAESQVIAYGGDHVFDGVEEEAPADAPHQEFDLAISRIEPENNVEMILSSYAANTGRRLVYVGNWRNSAWSRELYAAYSGAPGISLIGPIYYLPHLKYLRARASVYIHGHSAGGTNPSLVEAMFFGAPVVAFDCPYNHATLYGRGFFFRDQISLQASIALAAGPAGLKESDGLAHIARERYLWRLIGKSYFGLIEDVAGWNA